MVSWSEACVYDFFGKDKTEFLMSMWDIFNLHILLTAWSVKSRLC